MTNSMADKKKLLIDLLEKKVRVYHNGTPCVVVSCDDWEDVLNALVEVGGAETVKKEQLIRLAEAVVAAADTHVHYPHCSSNVGCNCEQFDLEGPVMAYREAKGKL